MLVRIRSFLLVFSALLGLGATSSQAWADSSSLHPPSDLVLTLARGDGTDPGAPIIRAVTLTCMPQASGTHPHAQKACDLLGEVDGYIADLSGSPGACTREYMPVTVTADGVWQGRRVTYEQTFDNWCILLRARGVVFNF
ncbi:SSI family serine proteinase inhibitor [Streptomyces syringium]|uniref:SSI family serine proteinase inhibitor n=1 Tax=Streptomyces syringium TaxID=76729 RepID=UPI0033EB8B8D